MISRLAIRDSRLNSSLSNIADLHSGIAAVRSELASERDERLEHQGDVDAQISLIEASLRARPASAPRIRNRGLLLLVDLHH